MEQSVIVGIITFCLGVIFGHRLTLWRDRRKEFNDIAMPIRAALLKERERPSPMVSGLSAVDADALAGVLPFWSRRRFRKHWEGYRDAKHNSVERDSVGGCYFANTEQIVEHIDRVLSFTRRR